MGKDGRLVVSGWLLVVGLLLTALVVSACEVLPGSDIPPGEELRQKQPGGGTLEYFTGTIEKIEQSIIGPKVTVKKEKTQADRTFFIAPKGEVWLGIEYSKTTILKKPRRVKISDLKEGQRVACYINKSNQAVRIHILER